MTDLVDDILRLRRAGVTYAEISRRTGATRNMVAGYLHRARAPHSGPRVGEKHPLAKLSGCDVLEVRTLLSRGVSCAKIGAQFHVTRWTIRAIKSGLTWKHTPAPQEEIVRGE